MTTWYSGKQLNRMNIAINKYTAITPSRYTPAVKGSLMLELYLNFKYVLKPGYLTGVVRFRAVRETKPETDPTAYRDHTLTRKNLIITGDLAKALAKPSPEIEWLFTETWLGAGEPRLAMHWEVRPGPEFASAAYTTRYAKAELV